MQESPRKRKVTSVKPLQKKMLMMWNQVVTSRQLPNQRYASTPRHTQLTPINNVQQNENVKNEKEVKKGGKDVDSDEYVISSYEAENQPNKYFKPI